MCKYQPQQLSRDCNLVVCKLVRGQLSINPNKMKRQFCYVVACDFRRL